MQIRNQCMTHQQNAQPDKHAVQAMHIAFHNMMVYSILDQERPDSTQNGRSDSQENEEIKYLAVRAHKHKKPFQNFAVECFAGFGAFGLFHGESTRR